MANEPDVLRRNLGIESAAQRYARVGHFRPLGAGGGCERQERACNESAFHGVG
jgi:hypothetical protein